MFGFLPVPHYLPCPECGFSIESAAFDEHECDEERRLDHQMFQLRHLVGRFEWEFRLWLATPAGRFAAYWAEYDRARRRAAA